MIPHYINFDCHDVLGVRIILNISPLDYKLSGETFSMMLTSKSELPTV